MILFYSMAFMTPFPKSSAVVISKILWRTFFALELSWLANANDLLSVPLSINTSLWLTFLSPVLYWFSKFVWFYRTLLISEFHWFTFMSLWLYWLTNSMSLIIIVLKTNLKQEWLLAFWNKIQTHKRLKGLLISYDNTKCV